VGTNNALFGITFDPRRNLSTGFQSMGGQIVGNPSCADPGEFSGHVFCGVKGGNNGLFSILFDPRSGFNSGFTNLGGHVVGNPSCAETGPADIVCVIVSTDHALHSIDVNLLGGPGGFVKLGGNVKADPSCAMTGGPTDASITCAVKNNHNNLLGIGFLQ
jgi:hypothetical protein